MVFFTADQERFRDSVRDFTHRELSPRAGERAELDHILPEVIQTIAGAGYLGLTTPGRYGGNPTDCVSIGILFEEISTIDFAPMPLLLNHVMIPLMLRWSSEAFQIEWLPLLCSGRKIPCFGNTEPDCGSDAGAIKAKAVRDGDSYILSGEKTSVSVGMQADVLLMTAKMSESAGPKGITCFFVPLHLPGINRQRFVDMGAHPHGRAAIALDEVRVPAEYRIGEEGEGFTKIMRGLDFCRVLAVLGGIGMAQASLNDAIDHLKSRQAFGHPIGKFEGVSFRLAEDDTHLHAARLLCYQALKLRDEGLRHTKEAAMAKWFGAQYAARAIHNALLALGWRGYSRSNDTERRFRDAFGLQIGDGTAEIMKLIISREILGSEFGAAF
jgi:cyclohexanecarboxyl-CoA dehydrogenase